MATLTVFHATRLEPAEYRSTHPAPCATCGALWDEEDHLDTEVEAFDGLFYCMETIFNKPSCIELAKLDSYRTRAAAIVKEKLAECIEELDDLYQELPVDEDAHELVAAAIASIDFASLLRTATATAAQEVA